MPEKNSLGDRLKKERAQAATAANYASGLQNFRDSGMNIFDVAGPGSLSPGGYTYNVPNNPSIKQSSTSSSAEAQASGAFPRKKINEKYNPMVSSVDAGIKPMGIQKPAGDFKISGAISTSMGGNTDYQAGLQNLSKSVNTKTASAPTRKEMRIARRVERLERRQKIQKQKGQLAMQEGRFGDAKQKNWRAQNLQKRIDRNKARM